MSGGNAIAASLDSAVKSVLAEYDFSSDVVFHLVNVSENWTYRVDDPARGCSAALRVHRPNYHSREEIESELTWIDALRGASVVNAPAPIAARDGGRVRTVAVEGGPARHVTLFDWLPGAAPSADADLIPSFGRLGDLASRMHLFGIGWRRPSSFCRFTYDDAAVLEKVLWGRWQDAPGIGVAEEEVLSRACDEIRRQLAGYGRGTDRFGLCHNDLRLANLLIDGERLSVIDFDDCGFSWYLNDFATAVSFMEGDPRVGDWMAAWLGGYTRTRALTAEDRAILPTLIMLRRMLLVGWVGFHYEHAAEARALGADYATGACRIAEDYLSGRYLT
ncbi:phosphotransferase enzyme family protein [Albidovulum sp.]|jgi:Ser/Thr protein kinase RdoA (MazF antagonist)|uniref:phosphotransferase enzyme family protein n=1 Tax=Albidovulum sp. TaxID=1872424 RepID=UPI00305DA476